MPKKSGKPPSKQRDYDPTSARARRFCLELLKDFNGARAARDAGYAPGRARQTASELLAMPAIQAQLTALCTTQRTRTEVDVDTILTEFVRIGLSDIAGAFNEFGGLLPLSEIPIDVRRAISSIETEEIWEWEGEGKERKRVQVGEIRKVKFWNKLEGLTALAKRLSFFPPDKLQHDVHLSWEQVLASVPDTPMPRAVLAAGEAS